MKKQGDLVPPATRHHDLLRKSSAAREEADVDDRTRWRSCDTHALQRGSSSTKKPASPRQPLTPYFSQRTRRVSSGPLTCASVPAPVRALPSLSPCRRHSAGSHRVVKDRVTPEPPTFIRQSTCHILRWGRRMSIVRHVRGSQCRAREVTRKRCLTHVVHGHPGGASHAGRSRRPLPEALSCYARGRYEESNSIFGSY
jgi:hypothetical protein